MLINLITAFCLAVACALVWYGKGRLSSIEDRMSEVEDMLAVKPHTRIARDRMNYGEASLFKMRKLRNVIERLEGELATTEAYLQHIANGGDPDAPPATWFQPKEEAK
jgi:hypothetical protein